MAQYIDKSALIAEIEKIYYEDYKFLPSDLDESVQDFKDDLLRILDTLEVKDVDFETEWKKYFEHKGNLATVNVKDLAKHFFDLGLKAQKGE